MYILKQSSMTTTKKLAIHITDSNIFIFDTLKSQFIPSTNSLHDGFQFSLNLAIFSNTMFKI